MYSECDLGFNMISKSPANYLETEIIVSDPILIKAINNDENQTTVIIVRSPILFKSKG